MASPLRPGVVAARRRGRVDCGGGRGPADHGLRPAGRCETLL